MELSPPSNSLFFLHALTLTTLLLTILLPPAAAVEPTTTDDFVEKSCASATRYPDLCVATLSPHASAIQTSPKLLATAALSVALAAARSASKSLQSETAAYRRMVGSTVTMSPGEAAAWRDCRSLVRDSVDQLRRSVKEMGGDEKTAMMTRFQLSNVQTWASAAMTDLDTCTDGLSGEGVDGEVKRRLMESGVVDVGHMISNALAFVNQYGDGIN
ncbi:unnamed protein product [Linum tenue]|uniref:Pectinesterase inhibitor domain-containing protein n=2 Tax=Linum tenue TaxID=586396 RepID=A0AAV0Q343_9ROSI|nr:unnamed protein product [Linum tenue]